MNFILIGYYNYNNLNMGDNQVRENILITVDIDGCLPIESDVEVKCELKEQG